MIHSQLLDGSSRSTSGPTNVEQVFYLGKTTRFQTGKLLGFINENGEFTFLLADHHLNIDRRQAFLQFRSETRCTGLMPSRRAINNFNLHCTNPFLVRLKSLFLVYLGSMGAEATLALHDGRIFRFFSQQLQNARRQLRPADKVAALSPFLGKVNEFRMPQHRQVLGNVGLRSGKQILNVIYAFGPLEQLRHNLKASWMRKSF
ncbi:MAG: hypothetical protein SCH72_10775 [Desulfuromonadales bacterium]|nr:hypothetical protein [Desulfuromonadales bacterium]